MWWVFRLKHNSDYNPVDGTACIEAGCLNVATLIIIVNFASLRNIYTHTHIYLKGMYIC